MVTMKNDDGAANGRKKRKPKVRPGAMLLKYFHNIASADLNALFPDVRVVMGLRDQLWHRRAGAASAACRSCSSSPRR